MERLKLPNFNILLLGKYFWNVLINSNPLGQVLINITISACLIIFFILQPIIGIAITIWFFFSIRLIIDDDEPYSIKDWCKDTFYILKLYRKIIYCKFKRNHFIRFDFNNKYSFRNKGLLLYFQYSWVDRNIVNRMSKWNH